jgi:hypothetical protein
MVGHGLSSLWEFAQSSTDHHVHPQVTLVLTSLGSQMFQAKPSQANESTTLRKAASHFNLTLQPTHDVSNHTTTMSCMSPC